MTPRSTARFSRAVLFIFALLLSLVSVSLRAEIQVDIEGISGDLKQNVELYVGKPVNDNELNIVAFIGKLPSEARKSLQAMGYYNSEISVERSTSEGKNKTIQRITLSIKRGPAVKITSMEILLKGDINTNGDREFRNLLDDLPLKTGDVLNHGLYEKTKDILYDTAQDRGYFDARFMESTARVNRQTNTAEILLVFDSGQRYLFGNIHFDSDYFNPGFLKRWVPFEPGTPYEARLVAELTQHLQASGYFSRVRVRTVRDKPVGNLIPIEVTLNAVPANKVGFGVGFATDTGPRVKTTWRRPRNNRQGHSIDTAMGISDVRQDFTARYKIPKQRKPLTDYYLADFGALNEKTEDRKSQLRTLNFQRVRETGDSWQETVFVRWENETWDAGQDSGTSNLILPGISWARTKTRGGVNPYWGNHVSVQFLGGHKDLFSDINLFKSVLSMKWLRTFREKHKLIMSLGYGAIASDEFNQIPASHRFYVGGDRSIRGFKYRSISPEDENGKLLGGRFKEVGSIEYDYKFYEKWSVAVFADAGRAFDKFDERYRVGTGIGVRWQSPVGPVRLDMGVGVSEEDMPVLFHLSIGPEL